MRKTVAKSIAAISSSLLVLLLLSTAVTAQTFKVVDYVNAYTRGIPDATLRLTNGGATGGYVCAMIYVFTPDQQMTECCGCVNSPDNLLTLSVNNDLTSNPLTGVPPHAGVIKVVEAAENNINGVTCNPTRNVTVLSNTIVGWITHLQPNGSGIAETEVPLSLSPLGGTELANLQAQCTFAQQLGSGQGVCSCGGIVE